MPTDRSHGASPDSNSAKLSARLSPRLLARVSDAVEDGPYHSRSHLVRTALQLLLTPTDRVPESESADSRTRSAATESVRVGAINEELPAEGSPPRVAVEVVDDDAGGADPATHTFVYDLDRTTRTATVRTYDPPPRLTHEQATSLGSLRDLADEALAARNWRVEAPAADTGRDDAPGERPLATGENAGFGPDCRYADGE